MSKKPILIIGDDVYSLKNSKVSLVNLIKHNCENLDLYTFRDISSKGINNLSMDLSKRLNEFSRISRKEKGIAYVLCGLHECDGGYNVPIYQTLISSIIIELNEINFDVVFINPIIDHGLPGKIGGWYKRSRTIISECCEKFFSFCIEPSVGVRILENDVSIPVESSRIIVRVICDDLEDRRTNEL